MSQTRQSIVFYYKRPSYEHVHVCVNIVYVIVVEKYYPNIDG